MGTAGRARGGEPLKLRVNRCLLKLSDRDTEAMAAAELEAIARALAADELGAFVSAVSDARPTDKTPLRRHALRALALVAAAHPRDAVAPLVPRILAAALRRVRDQDSSVRAALVDTARAAAAASASASPALRPLTDALLHEQDQCAQTAAALATAAAVEASAPTADLASYIHKLQPRLLKLLRSNAFKAKPALISLIGVSASAAGAAEVTASVPCLRDTIASDDWAARKAAAEALAALALEHKDLLVSYKSSCITMFEARRFDKVKIVRDSMNRMIEAWKEIPDVEEDECSSGAPPASHSQRRSSLAGSASDGRYPVASSTRRNSLPASRSPPPDASPSVNKRHSSSSARNKKQSPSSYRKAGQAKNRDYKVDIAVTPDATPIKVVTEEKLLKGGNVRSRLEARRMLFQDGDDRATKVAGLKAGSRVVPYEEGGNMEEISEIGGGSERFQTGYKDEGLSEIRSQLLQIENQQSSLLDLIQKFMGKSENGMNSLETRVHGLEMALDEISRDLAASSGRTSNSEAHVNSCCILNPKFWRRHDASRYSSSFSVSDGRNSSEGSRTSYKWGRQKFGVQGGFVTNPLAEPNISSAARTATAQEGRRKDLTLPKSRMG
uniref:TORTIFOLIA1/SINE1-2 N-terminal domain-containing protein n=1 Tax=Oryza meridionalis TaxID=40149 RepID=A0A0E0CR87_9ORYZ